MDEESAEVLNKENRELRSMVLHLQVRMHAAEKKLQENKELRQLVRQLQVRLYVAETKQQETVEDINHLKSVQEQEKLRLQEDANFLKIAHEDEVARINARNEKLLAEAIEMHYSAGRKHIPQRGTCADGDTGSSSDPVGMIQMLQEEDSDISGSMPSPEVQKALLEDAAMGSPEPESFGADLKGTPSLVQAPLSPWLLEDAAMASPEPESFGANLKGTPSLVQAPLSPVVGSSPTPSATDTPETHRWIQDTGECPAGHEDTSASEVNVDARKEKCFGPSAGSATPGIGSSDDLPNGVMLDKIALEMSDISQQLQAKELLSEYFGMKFDTLHHAIQHMEASPLAEARLKALYHKFTRHFNLPGQLIVPSLIRLCKKAIHVDKR